ncbi:XRE family transcriptional regulator [Actinomadura sp. KC345]|uniref:helix-turn-helix domain-containing protein n=1 Tax=Actinomadura sp. KC345 TaxID=2530371 RepID=UPI001049FF9E|nr:helix-turn-helix transcriptional regulator [Actinomadura sp. KC345]TDC54465.1 XRE family transcriptional regulator [Actinomadura sp. KC345]
MTTFGEKLRALMAERQISQRKLAKLVPCDGGHLSKIANGHKRPSPELANRLDELLEADGKLAALRPERPSSAGEDILNLAAWLEETNVGDGAVGHFETATRRLVYDYPRQPPLAVLHEAQALQERVWGILRGGRQRIAQTRAILAVSAELFALISLLAGDIARYRLADAYGYAAWTCADEADSDAARAIVLCAKSKTARWEGRYVEAADLARQGFELAPATARARVLLAVSEATALQSRGDIRAATAAVRRAQSARDAHSATHESADAWSCTRAREAAYALQVGLGARDPGRILRSVADADDAWADGDQWVYGTWAQVRIGAALAHVMSGDIEDADAELDGVFDLGTEYRVVTIVGRMGEISRRLGHRRYEGDPRAAELREKIRAFQAGSLEHEPVATRENL